IILFCVAMQERYRLRIAKILDATAEAARLLRVVQHARRASIKSPDAGRERANSSIGALRAFSCSRFNSRKLKWPVSHQQNAGQESSSVLVGLEFWRILVDLRAAVGRDVFTSRISWRLLCKHVTRM